jgi:hypothetical protein
MANAVVVRSDGAREVVVAQSALDPEAHLGLRALDSRSCELFETVLLGVAPRFAADRPPVNF